MPIPRRSLAALLCLAPSAALTQPLTPATPPGAALVERVRRGGLVLFIRHADTAGEPCDRGFRIGDRAGQRNISPDGRRQAEELGRRFAALGIPVAWPVLAGPVFRARDTAELAFGAERVAVTDSLTADDYAGGRLPWVLEEHRRLLSVPVPEGRNRVLVGHRGPVQILLGEPVAGTRLPEAGVMVAEPLGPGGFRELGILALVPPLNGGNPSCR
ncbi:histidine phosphatase family protein [Roseomonas marmotae]|uniref:Histidine phosphatase family protein n=1 Tax=Roseomonas marmotae TaxID=2768161 RepID=A0ABS3KFT2_9PROT|nr:histidine phosphatase family protein [Roseomonas marmotae]MBO1075201.1 histidine phosphatase family protein [Roseomonas marmotae]QTI79692.1 histidine phosphatase family protein [Roseomonas marmotae]